ncbi:hypothetical protein FC96_GL002431 [Secundilactobacillus kimchicus JCM 15530]|uniref:Uncharacterized protein n=1 Tax=Secundilactobacillus kimchicus JCM 15530 TaxID=1302272 RepID=A0A0R1HVK6_9LACO|nr:hypothetical protein FC96_GL002431 [Secundilactobacillus kimchicus JCM 15530]
MIALLMLLEYGDQLNDNLTPAKAGLKVYDKFCRPVRGSILLATRAPPRLRSGPQPKSS